MHLQPLVASFFGQIGIFIDDIFLFTILKRVKREMISFETGFIRRPTDTSSQLCCNDRSECWHILCYEKIERKGGCAVQVIVLYAFLS